jgi:hypothetical protein
MFPEAIGRSSMTTTKARHGGVFKEIFCDKAKSLRIDTSIQKSQDMNLMITWCTDSYLGWEDLTYIFGRNGTNIRDKLY